MTEAQWAIIRPLITDSCLSLFAAEGAYARLCGEVATATINQDGVTAFVGTTSAQIRGGIGLTLPLTLAGRIHPLRKRGVTPTERQLRDWTCELANQLAGRFKTKLLPHGIAFRVSTPMGLLGKDLRIPDDHGNAIRVIEFTCAGDPFFVNLEAQITPGAELRELPVENQEDAKEGEVLIF